MRLSYCINALFVLCFLQGCLEKKAEVKPEGQAGPASSSVQSNSKNGSGENSSSSITTLAIEDLNLETSEDSFLLGRLPMTNEQEAALTYTLVTQPLHGTVELVDATTGQVSYTPSANYNGSDSFKFKVTSGNSESPDATVHLTISAVNDAPVAAAGNFALSQDSNVNGSFSVSDIDGDGLLYTIVSTPSHGTAIVTNPAAGEFRYTPSPGFHGSDSFTFIANDGVANSNQATVSLSVVGLNNRAPIASNGTLSVSEDQLGGMTLSASDPDGDALTYSIGAGPAHGTLTLNNHQREQ